MKKKISGLFWKILIAVPVIHGMVCVTMSYILAWRDHSQVVEGVSQTIVSEILAPIVVGFITKTIENIFEKNKLAFSEPIELAEKEEQQEEQEGG